MAEETPEEKNRKLAEAVEARRKIEKAQEYGMTATVRLTLQVDCRSSWAGTATGQEVMDQGGKETMFAIENAFQQAGLKYRVIESDIGLIVSHRVKK